MRTRTWSPRFGAYIAHCFLSGAYSYFITLVINCANDVYVKVLDTIRSRVVQKKGWERRKGELNLRCCTRFIHIVQEGATKTAPARQWGQPEKGASDGALDAKGRRCCAGQLGFLFVGEGTGEVSASAPLVRRHVGASACWRVGVLARWCVGMSASWHVGVLARHCVGASVCWRQHVGASVCIGTGVSVRRSSTLAGVFEGRRGSRL